MRVNMKRLVSVVVVLVVVFGLSTYMWARPMPMRWFWPQQCNYKQSTNVLLVVPPKDIEDLEFFVTKSILEENGAHITVASTSLEVSRGSHGGLVKPDLKISNVKAKQFDAVIVIGGMGTVELLWDDEDLRELLIEANKRDLIVGAICGSSVALAKAGILQGRSSTVYTWDVAIKHLEDNGAIYADEDVVVCENIVTARNVDMSEAFGLKLCEVLELSK